MATSQLVEQPLVDKTQYEAQNQQYEPQNQQSLQSPQVYIPQGHESVFVPVHPNSTREFVSRKPKLFITLGACQVMLGLSIVILNIVVHAKQCENTLTVLYYLAPGTL